MLRSLGWAAAAASVGYVLDPDEQARVGSVLSNQTRLDPQTIEHVKAVLSHCEQQDDTLGPRGVIDTVVAQRELARSLLPDCPGNLRPRLLSILSEASRQVGWLSFDLKDFTSAGHFYEDARACAHEAGNAGLGAVVLCQMSHLATYRTSRGLALITPLPPGSGPAVPVTCGCGPTVQVWPQKRIPKMRNEMRA